MQIYGDFEKSDLAQLYKRTEENAVGHQTMSDKSKCGLVSLWKYGKIFSQGKVDNWELWLLK